MPVALFVGGKDVMLHSRKTAKRLGALLGHANINFFMMKVILLLIKGMK